MDIIKAYWETDEDGNKTAVVVLDDGTVQKRRLVDSTKSIKFCTMDRGEIKETTLAGERSCNG